MAKKKPTISAKSKKNLKIKSNSTNKTTSGSTKLNGKWGINEMQRLFCHEYVNPLDPNHKRFNGTQSAKNAGYSAKSASTISSQLLSKKNVKNYIVYLRGLREKRLDVTTDRVLQELGKIGFSNITDVLQFSENGNVNVHTDSELLPDSAKQAIAEVSETKDGIKIKMHSKTSALETLLRALGGIKDGDVNVTTVVKFSDMTTDELKRVRAVLRKKKGKK